MNASASRPLSLLALSAALAGLLAPGAAEAANLLENPSFDTDLQGWSDERNAAFGSADWSSQDARGLSSSGSALLVRTGDDSEYTLWYTLRQCVSVEAGAEYRARMETFLPGGQVSEDPPKSSIHVSFYEEPDCAGHIDSFHDPNVERIGEWISRSIEDIVAPTGADSARVTLSALAAAHFDNVYLGTGDPDGEPAPDPAGWFTDPTFPDFRFNVEISNGQMSRLGARESFCLDETVCVSGAVPGRVELQIRIVGPKPNGRLWPTLFKASTARFDVWIEQLSTGAVKHYVLEGASPGSSELPGLFDRDGFEP